MANMRNHAVTRLLLRPWVQIVLGVILVVVVVVVIRSSHGHPVLVAEATQGDLTLRIAASGLVEAKSADLSFRGSGNILSIYVEEGERVGRSQVLARIDPASSGPISPLYSVESTNVDAIHAPYDGTIVEVYLRPGVVVAAGQPVIRIVADESVWITGFVNSEDAMYMSPGDTYRCRAGGYLSQPWDIVIKHIGREAVARRDIPGSSRQVRVRFDPGVASAPIAPGTEVDIDGEALLAGGAALIPAAAVVRDGPRDYVWLVERGKVTRRDVSLGPNNFDLVQIRDGVAPGDLVVVNGKDALKEGMSVKASPMPQIAKPETGGE